MRFAVIASGSKANCTFIEGGNQRFLIDCGLSGIELSRRLLSLDILPESLNGIVVTHEHSDHIKGVAILSKKFGIPVYANEATAQFLSGIDRLEIFKTSDSFQVGDLTFNTFSIVHDASDPVGVTVQAEGLKFVHATDLGKVTTVVRHALVGCNALVLESNHDLGMLYESDYPWQLKQRIASSHGHLSNDVAGRLLNEIEHNDLNHVVLGHLSENCNTPEIALKTVKMYLKSHGESSSFSLSCGSVGSTTPLMRVGDEDSSLCPISLAANN